jgi:TonB-dependent SusC/RagA subfamily outer membrane receptor
MEILKDGSATAIYGSRAANGVILITTKRGKGGRFIANYNTYMGSLQPIQTLFVENQRFHNNQNEKRTNRGASLGLVTLMIQTGKKRYFVRCIANRP